MKTPLPLPDTWQPLTISQITSTFPTLRWILAGGYALELFVGKTYRAHGDIDILIARKDQQQLLHYLPQSRIFIATPPGQLVPFFDTFFYERPVQDIWILSEDQRSWCLQIMLVDIENQHWRYKRNDAIHLPFDAIYFNVEQIKVLKPEIQLLYKSKTIRPKDQLDFEMVYPKLCDEAKNWLQQSLKKCYEAHVWTTAAHFM